VSEQEDLLPDIVEKFPKVSKGGIWCTGESISPHNKDSVCQGRDVA
jgi:hypothetical protein